MYSTYKYLRPIAIFAGIIGLLQSLAWMAMAISGIIAYYCHFDFTWIGNATIGTIFELVFFQMYFQGTCEQAELPPNINMGIINALSITEPIHIHGWMWVYLVLSFLWLISSITLITNVRADYIKYANIFLYIWIFITLVISIIDLALAIVFGLDYEQLMLEGRNYQITAENVDNFSLLAGQISAGVMMVVAIRGFILWIINVSLMIYFFTETFQIHDHNRIQNGISNSGFQSEPHSMMRAKPIDGYAFDPLSPAWHTGQPMARTERSRSFSGGYPNNGYDDKDNRRHDNRYEQQSRHHPQQQSSQLRRRDDDVVLRRDAVARELNDRNSYNNNNTQGNGRIYSNEPRLPAPDYSPPMPRAHPFDNRPPLRSALRNSRYN